MIADVPRAALPYQAQLTREARYMFGMDAPIAMLAGQITQESSWDPNAKSPVAAGLAQFTSSTASWISGVYKELGPANPLDAGWALRAMVRFDSLLYKGIRIADTSCDRWLFALSDFNGGSGRRIGRQARSVDAGSWNATGSINPGISIANQKQNFEYGPRIMYRWQPVFFDWGTTKICL